MLLTQRVLWPLYNTPEKLRVLLDFLARHRSVCEEISFFTEGDGLDWRYVPPDEVRRRADYLGLAVDAARAAGFQVAINILNTMGHSDDCAAAAPTIPWRGIVGLNGSVARQCSCPFDINFQEYLTFKYEQFGRSGADKYWIDDDVRLGNHSPVEWGCFCEACLHDFSELQAETFDLNSIAAALTQRESVRRAWMNRNSDVMQGVLDACVAGVRRSAPQAEIGFMVCDVADLMDWGADSERWFTSLEVPDASGWLRPGGGFWSDDSPRDLLSKAHRVGNSIASLPAGVRATYEVENYPFIQAGKSAMMTGLEGLVATLATRLDGIMFDVLDNEGNDLAFFEDWVTKLGQWQPLWEQGRALVKGTVVEGWLPVYSRSHFVTRQGADTNANRHVHYTQPLTLQMAGLPITAFAESALGYLLCEDAALGLTATEMRALLEKPLLMDGGSAALFVAAGLGSEIGLRQVLPAPGGGCEKFTGAINSRTADYRRSVTLTYFGLSSHLLHPNQDTKVLSICETTGGESPGAYFTLHHPRNSPPVAVMGYLPWHFVGSPQRQELLQSLSDLMLDSRTTVRCDRSVAHWRRRAKATGRQLLVLFNAGFDAAEVRCSGFRGRLVLESSPCSVTDSPMGLSVTLPAWTVAVLQHVIC